MGNVTALKDVEERVLKPASGILMLFVTVVLLFMGGTAALIAGIIMLVAESGLEVLGGILLAYGIIAWIAGPVSCAGFHIVHPNEAIVLTFFGKYYGTIKTDGFFFTNPFATVYNPTAAGGVTSSLNANGTPAIQIGLVNKKVSTKVMTLNNDKQKVNDALGNPVIIGSVVIWRVADPTKAVFNVDNYKNYLSIQCDSTIRNIARLYPYDTMEDDADEKTLRGSSQEIAEQMKLQLQNSVKSAGIEIEEVRITHLAYSEEIAAAMLQRQQAVAVIAARQKIVEGAVSMVKMAIDQLGEEDIVTLDEERKAAMVSNLLVVLCGNKDAQPIVNSGSIY